MSKLDQCSYYRGRGHFPPLRLSVSTTVRLPDTPEGTVFVPGSAGALHTSQISSSTSTNHMTHLMLSNFLSASILIITFVALLTTTVARDRDRDSEDCSILVVLFFSVH